MNVKSQIISGLQIFNWRSNFLALTMALIFSNFASAQSDTEIEETQVQCDSQIIQIERHVEGIKVTSTKTARETELMCVGQCSIDEWACISVDGIPYLWFRGTNAARYALGPTEGYESLGHWAIQLNEVNEGIPLGHKHLLDISGYFNILDKIEDEQIVYDSSGLNYKQTLNRSKYNKSAHEKYPYIARIYEAAVFSKNQ